MARREYAKSAEHLEALEVRGDLAVRLADALLAGNELRAGELLTSYKEATEHLRELAEMSAGS